MSVVEMGPLTSGVVNLFSKGSATPRTKPLFAREIPYRSRGALNNTAPISTRPLNEGEFDELEMLHNLRDAIMSAGK